MTYRPNHSAFIRELMGDSYVDQPRPERYELRAFSDGYRITDRGELIATFHGPQYELAAGLLRRLKACSRSLPGNGECALASARAELSAASITTQSNAL